ncbi:MAG: hypothetical protein ACREPG_03040, partial [Candidatus Binatia bacterium]
MAKLIAAMALCHAFTFLEPKTWDQRREPAPKTGSGLALYHFMEKRALSTGAGSRSHACASKIDLTPVFQALEPELLMALGDDQNENFLAKHPLWSRTGSKPRSRF